MDGSTVGTELGDGADDAGDGSVRGRLAAVQRAVAQRVAEVGRAPGAVTLVAVSKLMGAERVAEALGAGQRVFGENYVQESAAKWPALRERFPDVELHLVGPLQSNKARDAVRIFDVIESLDRPSLAAALAKAIPAERARSGRAPRLLVQVNVGEEPQKAGILPADLDAFLLACRDTHGLAIEGLMCIPPADEPPSPYFAWLAREADRHGLPIRSMGMSADYDAAIQVGATHVRVGTAIFGVRPSKD